MTLLTTTAEVAELCVELAREPFVALDTEFMRDRTYFPKLCLIQLAGEERHAAVDPLAAGIDLAPLFTLLADPAVLKIFHFARFDLAAIRRYLGIDCTPVYCTKVASRLVRTYTDRHGLKDLCRELLGVELSKQQQSSDWGAATLSQDQLAYAASDVLYLHDLRAKLDVMLAREGREELARACFEFLPARAALDIAGWQETDIFAH